MVICPQCNIEHGEGEEYCRECGKFLLTVEDPLQENQKEKIKLTCPKCQLLYAKGNYCRKCGSLLMRGTPPLDMGIQILENKLIKKWSKQWLRMAKEEKELKTCLVKLETQREKISNEVFDSIFIRYKSQLESLSPQCQEMDGELKSIRKRTLEGIDLLEKELKPFQKRLGEIQSLYKTGAIIKADFIKEKREIGKEIKSRERHLKKHRHTLSLLPSQMGGKIGFRGFTGNFFRPFPLAASIFIIILMGVGGYFLFQGHSYQTPQPRPEETLTSYSPPLPSRSSLQTLAEAQEVEKINSLFENIKKANLQKNIDLFMSCFSHDFKGRDGKRLDALKMWENFNYLDLSYELKNKSILEDISHVQLEWVVKTSQNGSGKTQEDKTLLEVTLKKEEGSWKIKEIKRIS